VKQFLSYTVVALPLVVVATLGIGTTLDEVGRRSLWWAAGIALAVQFVAFGVLLGVRGRRNAFLLAFLGGGLARLGTLGVAGLTVTGMDTGLAPAPLVLGLAGYFFALLLLEALFLRHGTRTESTE
jgi:hypothetical protein